MAINTTKIPSGYKQTKIGIIPEDWEVKKLGTVFNFLRTASYSRAQTNGDGDVGYIHYGDIHTKFNYHLDLSENRLPKISEEKLKNYDILKDGDLAIADASEDHKGVGKSVEIENVGNTKNIAGLHTFLLRDKGNNFEPGFKGYLTTNEIIKRQFYKLAVGVKVYSLSKGILSSVQIPLPPLPEQRAIAASLSTWDKAIEKTQKLIEQLKQRNKGLMQQLLSGTLRLRSASGERFCGEWKERKLGEVAKGINSSLSLNSLRLEDGGYPVYGATNLIGYLKDYKFDTEYIGIVKDGAGVGRISFHPSKSSIIGTMTSIHAKENNNIHFLFYLLSQIKFEKFISGSTIPHIYFKDYSKTEINIPNLKEQTTIATVLDKSTQEVQLQEEKLTALKEQKKGLMQVLLTGKLRLRSAQEKRRNHGLGGLKDDTEEL